MKKLVNADSRRLHTDNAGEFNKIEKDNKFLYKELSYQLVGCFYDVYNELGPAHKEQIYHEALKIAYGEKELDNKSKPRIPVHYHEKKSVFMSLIS